MSRHFESGTEGISAIGYDSIGGTSYGMYQFSSRQGTVDLFIRYLYQKAPDIADELYNAGKSNTGSVEGTMPSVWRKIADESPERFAQLQQDFAINYYYIPIAEGFKGEIPQNQAMQEVLFSTAIHHGVQGATSIIQQALQPEYNEPTEFIRRVYTLRKKQFSSSTPSIRTAVHQRLTQEMDTILALYGL
ncbi:MAG: hypothetical protein K2M30_01110 [Desulfovibrionaceae bacterium]|nr:hypothetical protein [Desulfovibrionaceae bacterium]